jgi:two-component system sensor histidine kinase UhpB
MITSNIGQGTSDHPISILHLEDSELDHRLVCRALNTSGIAHAITRVDSMRQFEEAVEQTHFDVILADYRLPGFTALDAWSALVSKGAAPPFILLSGAIGEAAAVAAIQLGMSDFLHKDDLPRLGRVVFRALEVFQTRAAKALADKELAESQKRLSEFAEHLQGAIEGERASIAREIHDDIGGSLAAANLDLSWISRHAVAADMQTHAQSAIEMLQHALGASQRIMMNLRPAILDQGLIPSIQWLAAGFERRTGISTQLSTNNTQLCPEKSIALTAYRTAQEALTNVSKYANCSQVRIDVSDAEGVLTLEVSDNGLGIPAENLLKPASFGIRGLKERARMVGGWLDVSSRVGLGTSITLSIPLNNAHPTSNKDQFT